MDRELVMCLHFDLSHEKATQALNFFARRSGGEINKMKALKLVYLADRYHLRKYGRPVVGDDYYAMKQGPVPSMTKDLAEKSAFLDECEREYVDRFIEVTEDHLYLRSRSAVDDLVFSDSDEEALTFAWDTFGTLDEWDLVEVTHAYPEWNKHREALTHEDCKRVRMSYGDFFRDADAPDRTLAVIDNRDVFAEVSNREERVLAWELMVEQAEICALWQG